MITRTEGRIIETVSVQNHVHTFIVKLPSDKALSLLFEIERKELPFFVETNKKFKICFIPNDPYWRTLKEGKYIVTGQYKRIEISYRSLK